MDWQQLFEGLDLDDDRVLHQQVDSVSMFQPDRPIKEWKRPLSIHLQPLLRQLEGQASFVRGFQQPRSEPSMNLDGAANDLACNPVDCARELHRRLNRRASPPALPYEVQFNYLCALSSSFSASSALESHV